MAHQRRVSTFVHSIGIPTALLLSRVSISISFGASPPFLVSRVSLRCLCDFEVCACLSLSLLCAFVFGDGVRETKKDFATLCSSSSSSSSSSRWVEHCLSLSIVGRDERRFFCVHTFAFELIDSVKRSSKNARHFQIAL